MTILTFISASDKISDVKKPDCKEKELPITIVHPSKSVIEGFAVSKNEQTSGTLVQDLYEILDP